MEFDVDKIQAAGAAPVVHGRWITAHGNPTPYCSQCRKAAIRSFFGGYFNSGYCPNCGAKMDKEAVI